MLRNRALCCVLLMLCSTALVAADKPAAKKKPPPGRSETLACRLGTEDRHARIAVVVKGGKTDSFAYYSKWKPRTCSIYLQRNRDTYSKWADNGNITTVNLERGAFLIEHKPGEYHFIFRDIDRERYCGMDGVINGSLVIRRGSDECHLEGDIMVEGTPLGEAHAQKVVEEPHATNIQTRDTSPAPAVPPAREPAAASTSTSPQPGTEPAPPAPAAATQPDPAPPPSTSADVAQKPPATPPPATGSVEKAAGAESSNPFRAFFRSLSQQPPPEQQAQ